MKLYKQKLLTDAQLKRLGEHKYSCSSSSVLDKLLQPYWNWLCSKIPLWLAPNLLTIIGLMINIFTSLLLVWYSPDAKAEAPRWACALCAVGLFVYQSLDAIDGKQARRTGSASPLGELFDHGCDSMSTVFVAISACAAVQMGYYPGWMFFQCFCAMTLFYCAHWQTYVSGTLRFGKIDVTEAQYTIMVILLISSVFGPSVWSTKFFSDTVMLWYSIPASTMCVGLWNLYTALVVIFTGGCGKNGSTVAVIPGLHVTGTIGISLVLCMGYIQLFLAFIDGIKLGGCGKNGSTVAILVTGVIEHFVFIFMIPGLDMEVKLVPNGVACIVAMILAQANISVIFTGGGVGKNGSTVAGTSVLSPVIPFSMVLVPAFIIYQKSPEHVFEEHPTLYLLAFGLVAAKVTNRLVVAHMTKSEMDYTDWSLLGPTMLFLNQYFSTFIKEYYVLWLCLIWVAIDLMRYCYQICTEICDYLQIELFRIPCSGDVPKIAIPRIHNTSEKNGSSESKSNFFKEDRIPLLDDTEERASD